MVNIATLIICQTMKFFFGVPNLPFLQPLSFLFPSSITAGPSFTGKKLFQLNSHTEMMIMMMMMTMVTPTIYLVLTIDMLFPQNLRARLGFTCTISLNPLYPMRSIFYFSILQVIKLTLPNGNDL